MEGLSIHMAAAAIMQAIKPIEKASHNEGQKFWFRGIEEVMAALHPLFASHGVVIVPNVLEISHSVVGKNSKNNDIFCATARVGYALSGPKGDAIIGTSAGVAFDSADKAMPKALTMALKSFLTQTFIIPTYDTPDADSYDPTVDPRSTMPQAEDLTVLTDEVIATRIEALKAAHDKQEIETTAFIAQRNTLEDEQTRREEVAGKVQRLPATPPAPEKPATSRKTKTAPPAPIEQSQAQPIPPSDDPLPGVEPAPQGDWRNVKAGPECPVAAYRGKTLGELEPGNIQALRNGWAGNPKHTANIAVSEPKKLLAKAVLAAYRELFPEPVET